MKISWFALYCGLLLSVSAFSIDILLPSLLAIGADLQSSPEQTLLVIPVYMLALGLGNPVYGALSDRIGRRPGIFLGLGIYVVGACVCLSAATINTLLVGRFLQGFGAACAPVLCRAMIRDRHSGIELAKHMAVASMFFALGPMLAPLFGYAIYELFGWRSVFTALVFGAAAMIAATIVQEETLPPAARRETSFFSLRADTLAVYQHPQSCYFIILSCFCTGLILTFLSHAPVIYASFGVGPGRFAVLFALSSVGIVFGQYVNHWLISRLGSVAAASCAGIVISVTALVIWFSALTGTLNEYLFTLLMFTFNTSYLIIFSNFVSLTLEPHQQRAGTASAMFGFTSYFFGSVLAGAVSLIADQQVIDWAFYFFLFSAIVTVGTVRFKIKQPLAA